MLKKILFYKKLDLISQIAAGLLPVVLGEIYNFVYQDSAGDLAIFGAYISVLIVQAISCLLNRFLLNKSARCRTRSVHEVTVIVVLFVLIFLYFIPFTGDVGDFMVIILGLLSLVFIIWYFGNTCLEFKLILKVLRLNEEDQAKAFLWIISLLKVDSVSNKTTQFRIE